MSAIQWVVCMRVDQARIVVASSEQQDCARCTTKIWVSAPAIWISPDVPRICTTCALALVTEANRRGKALLN